MPRNLSIHLVKKYYHGNYTVEGLERENSDSDKTHIDDCPEGRPDLDEQARKGKSVKHD